MWKFPVCLIAAPEESDAFWSCAVALCSVRAMWHTGMEARRPCGVAWPPVAVVIADTHIYAHFYNIGPKYPCLAKNRTADPSTDHPGGPGACTDRGRGGGRCVGGRSGSGDARQARRCGCSWISGFWGFPGGWLGIPKSKSTVHGDYRVVSDPPQVAGHSLGGVPEVFGNFRQLPAIAGNCRSGRCSRVGQVFQSWAVWCYTHGFLASIDRIT